jgi:hypothetical protein
MTSLLTFILLGLLFAIPGEILNQILSRHDVVGFRHTLTSYAILLLAGFFIGRGINRIIANRSLAAIAYYLLFGTLGLMIEWFLLGNAPVLDPFQLITQPGMFTFWGTLLLGPRLIMEPAGFSDLKKSFLRFFSVFSCMYLLIAVIVPKESGGIFFGFVMFAAGTAALNYFYVKYFRRLRVSPLQ